MTDIKHPADTEFALAFDQAHLAASQVVHYGIEINPRVMETCASPPTVLSEWLVTSDHINDTGSIDEGVVATVTDNTLSTLGVAIRSAGKNMSMAVTELSAHTVRPIEPGTVVEMLCTLDSDPFITQPHATTVFRNKRDRACIYAVVFAAATKTGIANRPRAKSQPKL
ncbi:hypothetical protein IW140_003655 [Coemansia sp. RSA 1813]|nr:hypothetical protein EV178_002619 [Coemansia sp. RSA 1646]KAJ1770720.1 hypothetical protein LPJ74_002923 [Coemansia sp. RSA 1843]KAJ2088796.1 hypothetical protein IW138_003970 [Coemansia sp. RSA 986]KAJ2213732.1 hypothetical protein EV179_003632 [Coemansia sp. RSA 487]KAJ2568666.1 hypothetical protein IW140_003655 [Coemansia sp. RSA 1813]